MIEKYPSFGEILIEGLCRMTLEFFSLNTVSLTSGFWGSAESMERTELCENAPLTKYETPISLNHELPETLPFKGKKVGTL